MITPNKHEKSEWARMADAAAKSGRDLTARHYHQIASMPEGARLTLDAFDKSQELYRAWLIGGFRP